MRSRICLFFLLAFVLTSALPATAAGGETTIRVMLHERAQLEQLTRLVSIDNVRGLEVIAGASPKQLDRLVKEGFSFEIIDSGKQPELATMCAAGWVDDSSREYTCYPSYQQYSALMQRFADDNPTKVTQVNKDVTTTTTTEKLKPKSTPPTSTVKTRTRVMCSLSLSSEGSSETSACLPP